MRRLEGIGREWMFDVGERGGEVASSMSAFDEEKYGGIVEHPHYEPKNHPRMSREMRAVQFAPYVALSGYAGAIRRTVKFAELRAQRVIELNLDNREVIDFKNT